MVLAGAYWPYSSRAARIAPLSMSARIQAWAGPSGIGTDPDGWMTPTGTADAIAVPPASRQSAAAHARSLRMTGEPNAAARSCSIDAC